MGRGGVQELFKEVSSMGKQVLGDSYPREVPIDVRRVHPMTLIRSPSVRTGFASIPMKLQSWIFGASHILEKWGWAAVVELIGTCGLTCQDSLLCMVMVCNTTRGCM